MKVYLRRSLLVCILLAGAGVTGRHCSAAVLARGDLELARDLLARIVANQQKVSNFSCTVENLCNGQTPTGFLNPASQGGWHTETNRVAFDGSGRGRLEFRRPAQTEIHIWDGRRSIQFTSDGRPNSGDAIIRNEQHYETAIRNRPPWTIWGEKFCGFLRRAMITRSRVTVEALEDNMFRIDAAYGDGGLGIGIIDARLGYSVVYQEYHIAGELRQAYWARFSQVRPGVWFPINGQHVRFYNTGTGAKREVRTKTTISNIVVNDSNFDEMLSFELPFGTEVKDYSGSRHYVVGCKSEYPLLDLQEDMSVPTDTDGEAAIRLASRKNTFDSRYNLNEGEALKRIAPPFTTDRPDYTPSRLHTEIHPDQSSVMWQWDGKLQPKMCWSGRFMPLHAIIQNMLGLNSLEFSGARDLLNIRLAGDWVVCKEASAEDLLAALETIIRYETSRDIKFVSERTKERVIVARGKCSLQPLAAAPDDRIQIFINQLDQVPVDGAGTVAELLEYIARLIRKPVIDQTESSDMTIAWCGHDCRPLDAETIKKSEYNAELTRVLGNVAAQTGLSFEVETMPVKGWSVAELPGS